MTASGAFRYWEYQCDVTRHMVGPGNQCKFAIVWCANPLFGQWNDSKTTHTIPDWQQHQHPGFRDNTLAYFSSSKDMVQPWWPHSLLIRRSGWFLQFRSALCVNFILCCYAMPGFNFCDGEAFHAWWLGSTISIGKTILLPGEFVCWPLPKACTHWTLGGTPYQACFVWM